MLGTLLERSTKDMEIARLLVQFVCLLKTHRSGHARYILMIHFLPPKKSPRSAIQTRQQSLSFQSQVGNLDTYMFIITAAPPKRAATPTAPVFMGMAIPLLVELEPAPEAPAPLAVAVELAIAKDGVGMPLVNGTLEALLAPEKAGFCVLADTFGVASGFRGFSTLSVISDVFA